MQKSNARKVKVIKVKKMTSIAQWDGLDLGQAKDDGKALFYKATEKYDWENYL